MILLPLAIAGNPSPENPLDLRTSLTISGGRVAVFIVGYLLQQSGKTQGGPPHPSPHPRAAPPPPAGCPPPHARGPPRRGWRPPHSAARAGPAAGSTRPTSPPTPPRSSGSSRRRSAAPPPTLPCTASAPSPSSAAAS